MTPLERLKARIRANAEARFSFDPGKHPRGGYPANTGEFSPGAGGGGGGASADSEPAREGGSIRKLLANPSKPELQALFDSVYQKYGERIVLRGVEDEVGNHIWGSAYIHLHPDMHHAPGYLFSNDPVRLEGRKTNLLALSSGQIVESDPWPKVVPHEVAGIGRLKRA